MGTNLCLIGCGKAKLATAAPAGELYTGALFQACRRHAAGPQFDAWAILSARHGLLIPWELVEPYEQSLGSLGAPGRRAWAHRVLDQLGLAFPDLDRVTFLAGADYRRDLAELLLAAAIPFAAPLAGLGIGQQKHWLAVARSAA